MKQLKVLGIDWNEDMKNRSLTAKIFILIALTFLILGGAIYVFIYLSFPQKYMENKKENVKEAVAICLIDMEDANYIYKTMKEKLVTISKTEDVSIDIYLNDNIIYSINSDQMYSIEDAQESTVVDVIVERDLEKYEKIRIEEMCGQGEIVVDIYIPFKEVEKVVEVLISTYPTIIVLSIIMTVILSLIAAKRISRPMVCIIHKVNDMSTFHYVPKKEVEDEDIRDEINLLDKKIENMYYMLHESHINMKNEMKNQMKQEKLKFDFLRMAAHELKTPLTSVNGMLEGMYYNISPYDDREKYLLECQKVIGNMNRLIKDMLLSTEWNRKYIPEKVYIKDIIEKIVEMFAAKQVKKKIKLVIDIPDDFICHTSKEMLEGALKNIIHNSVIYCEENGIIHISLKEDGLHIFNSCMPLKQEEVERIFEAFYRKNNENDNDNGNGLGLYLVKRLLDILKIKYEFKASSICGGVEGMDFIIKLN